MKPTSQQQPKLNISHPILIILFMSLTLLFSCDRGTQSESNSNTPPEQQDNSDTRRLLMESLEPKAISIKQIVEVKNDQLRSNKVGDWTLHITATSITLVKGEDVLKQYRIITENVTTEGRSCAIEDMSDPLLSGWFTYNNNKNYHTLRIDHDGNIMLVELYTTL